MASNCPYDGTPAILVSGADIYPHRLDLHEKNFWCCSKCGAYAGCHPGTTKPVSRLAHRETRTLRIAAHAAFDPLWTSGRMTRTQAYRWLRQQTGLDRRACHIGWMTDDQLREVVRACRKFSKGTSLNKKAIPD